MSGTYRRRNTSQILKKQKHELKQACKEKKTIDYVGLIISYCEILVGHTDHGKHRFTFFITLNGEIIKKYITEMTCPY